MYSYIPSLPVLALSLAQLRSAAAQYFPPTPEDVTIVNSRFNDGVYISYKEPQICETTPGVRSYFGHVHLPEGTLSDLGDPQPYPINVAFWFFEAREDPANAPLSMWMNGGPGSSSMFGLFTEHGPCYVNPDSNSTYLSDWSWNNEVNMLYLDQPTQVGWSYDTLVNVTSDLIGGDVVILNNTDPIPEQNNTLLVGTYPSQNENNTARGSMNGARALWHFSQVWFQEFPDYRPNDNRISVATQSYGGRYGPAIASFFERQNQLIENGTLTEEGEMYIIHLDTLLIVNGCIDRMVQWPSYPQMAFNNTYGIQTVNESTYEAMMAAITESGGCNDQIMECQALAREFDPTNQGYNASVNEVCEAAESFCSENIRDPYTSYSGRNYYDVATLAPVPFPPPFYNGFLNQPWVQAALGAPLNWTGGSDPVARAYRGMGDYVRPGWLEDLAFLLANDVKVTLMYGDRDFACNWIGGEAASLAIPWDSQDAFAGAGYADLVTNDSYVGGQVRQYGNLSYVRVYQAGHEVPAYQPETAYRIFTRSLFNRDIATGDVVTASNPEYSTEGPSETWGMQEDLPDPRGLCYTLDPQGTCYEDQIDSILDGSALIRNYILINENTTDLFPPGSFPDQPDGGSGNNDTGSGGGGGGDSTGELALPEPTSGSGGAVPGAATSLERSSTIVSSLVLAVVYFLGVW